MNPSALAAWPRWIETSQGEITITGRHRSSRTNKIASELTAFIGVLVLIDGFCFSYSAVNRAIVVLAKLYNPTWTTDGIYACICLGGFFGTIVVLTALTPLISLLVRQKSTIRFSSSAIEIPRRFFLGWRRIDRSAAGQIEFFARSREHVNAYRHEDKQGNISSGVTAFDVFTIYMRFGWGSEVRLGEFINEEKAASFMAMSRAAAAATQASSSRQSLPVVTMQSGRQMTAQQEALPRFPDRQSLGERVTVRRRIT